MILHLEARRNGPFFMINKAIADIAILCIDIRQPHLQP
jgi:hypothetical protein